MDSLHRLNLEKTETEQTLLCQSLSIDCRKNYDMKDDTTIFKGERPDNVSAMSRD